MITGLYLSAQGAELQMVRQDVVANNLANASTTGFKQSLASFQAHAPRDVQDGTAYGLPGNVEEEAGGVALAEIKTDFSPGGFLHTGSALDVAIAGSGFLKVSDGKQQFLTRDGNLDIDAQGRLVTENSRMFVMGAGGPLKVDVESGPIEIAPDGLITQNNGQVEVGRLAIAEPDNYRALEALGDGLYRLNGRLGRPNPATEIKQGELETSTVSPVKEILNVIESSRVIEANLNMIKYQDDSLDRLLSSLPRK